MIKTSVSILCICLPIGCANLEGVKRTDQGTNRGYFSDAVQCYESAMRKESIRLPTAGSVSNVDIPIGYDANIFIVCMGHAGRPVSRVDVTDYLKVSTACLQNARALENSDEGYADCIKRSRLSVEIINDK